MSEPADALSNRTREILARWHAPDAVQDSARHTYLAFLDAAERPCLRANVPGHLTASAAVLTADGSHVLLTLHPRVGKWVQLGGHCEPADRDIAAAALREATEESGIPGLRLTVEPVHLHTHPITCSLGVPTRHLDVRFAAVAPQPITGELPPIVRSDESIDLAWWPVDALPDEVDHASVPDLVGYARRALRAAGLLTAPSTAVR